MIIYAKYGIINVCSNSYKFDKTGFLRSQVLKGRKEIMRNINSMADLKAKALVVTDGMETFFPQFNVREKLTISGIQTNKLTYAYNNSVVAFVDEEGTFYVTPDLKGTQKTLSENGYAKAYFYVPFSNWDYPVAHKEQWEKLWEEKNAK